ELVDQAAKVAAAVVVAVEEPADVDLVEDRPLEPERVPLEPLLRHGAWPRTGPGPGLRGTSSAADPYQMRLARLQPQEVAADVPRPVLLEQQLAHAIGRWEAGRHRHDAYALLGRERIEIDDDDDRVVAAALDEREELLVLRLEDREIVEHLERGALAAR